MYARVVDQDVEALLALGRACVVLALWDMRRLLDAGSQGNALEKMGMRAAARKALFFAAWANEQAAECYEVLHAEVGLVRVGLASGEQQPLAREGVAASGGVRNHGHTLIEEL